MAKREEKALSAPQFFIEKTRAYQVYELIVQGYKVQQIADKLGVTEERIRQVIAAEEKAITIAMQSLREEYQTVTMARTDYLYHRLVQVLMAQLDGEPTSAPNKDLFRMIMDVLKFQKEIAQPPVKESANDNRNQTLIQQTFVANSDFYDAALQEMQKELHGYTAHHPEQPSHLIIQPDERIVEIEELASKFLPDGIPADEPDTDRDNEI